MRRFNTTGPCDPRLHYYIPRTELLQMTLQQIAGEGDEATGKKGRYFTCPLYQKKLYAYFKPKFKTEQKNYLLPGEDYGQF